MEKSNEKHQRISRTVGFKRPFLGTYFTLEIIMKNHATEILLAGRKFVDPIMTANGFSWEALWTGQSSGGISDSGRYVKGDRNIELHYRGSLGLVTYHIGTTSLSHEQYMRHVAPRGAALYPGFSEEPLGAFKHLAHDLHVYAQDFLAGSGAEFQAAKIAEAKRANLSGLQRLGDK